MNGFGDERLDTRDDGDDRPAVRDQAGRVHRGLGDADDGDVADLAAGVEARIAEARDHVAVVLALRARHGLERVVRGDRLVGEALDRARTASGAGAVDLRGRRCHRARGVPDLIGHRLRGVGVDHEYSHQSPNLLAALSPPSN
jgi:hypothetical protein